MDHSAMAWTWAQRAGGPDAKLVLLALASCCGNGGWAGLPSDLARLTEMEEIQVKATLDDLEERGLISREGAPVHGGGRILTRLRLPAAARA